MITVEISRKAVKAGITLDSALAQHVPALAHELLPIIRTRVQDRGDLGGQTFPGYSTRSRFFATSPRYADGVVGYKGPSGAEFFPNSAQYHAQQGTRLGSYSVTGGMWAGLSVVVDTGYRATIEFRGRSAGQSPNFTRTVDKRAKNPQGGVRVRPLKINNRLKAWTILEKHGVNVLALAERELEGIARGAVYVAALGTSGELPVEWQGWTPPQSPALCVAAGFQ